MAIQKAKNESSQQTKEMDRWVGDPFSNDAAYPFCSGCAILSVGAQSVNSHVYYVDTVCVC